MNRKQRGLLLLVLLIFTFSAQGAIAEETGKPALVVNQVIMSGAENSFVVYPQLEGGENGEVVEKINLAIRETAQIDEYLTVLSGITEGSTGLRVKNETDLTEHYLSVVISAEGKMPQGRPSQRYYAMVFDLLTGDRLPFEHFVSDGEAALQAIEGLLESSVYDLVSTYMENSSLTPVPAEHFALLHGMIIFYYENDQLSFLSGDSGAISFYEYELAPYLNEAAQEFMNPISEAAQKIAESAAAGKMPGLFAGSGVEISIGSSMKAITDAFKQTTDSGYHPLGAYIETENPYMRGNYILCDENEETVVGFLCKRIDMFGIKTGVTTADEWRVLLGEPETTESIDEAAAEEYKITVGIKDVYVFGNGRRLSLSAGQDGILNAVILE